MFYQLQDCPSIVLGRRGSGKTSYLKTVYFDDSYDNIVELNTASALENVIEAINKFSGGPVFVESVAEIWDKVIFIGFISQVKEKLENGGIAKKFSKDYLAKIGVETETIDGVFWKLTKIIAESAKNTEHGVISEILINLHNVSLEKTKTAVYEEFKSLGKTSIILLDSLDDFKLHLEKVGRSIQGLLKYVGASNKPNSLFDVRFCLPSELYHSFLSISSNPNKDFKRTILLQWISSELIMIAGHRLNLFLNLYEYQNFNNQNPIDKEGAQKILKKILPPKIKNYLGVFEDPIAYILRHTQLLPRHLIMILNSIYKTNKRHRKSSELLFTEDGIREGIAEVEPRIVDENFNAYSPVYPKAKIVCERCIPELHNKFSLGDLERIFRQQGKSAMESDDFFEFKSMLIEIGAIGRVIRETELYVQGEFEYTVPHKLVTGTDDLLCIHPLFSRIFSAKVRDHKPVYPYGSVIMDKDYRMGN